MKTLIKRIGLLPLILIGGALFIFAIAAILEHIGGCTYDDLLNVWTCTQLWTVPVMEDSDALIFLGAYPALLIGFCIPLFKALRYVLKVWILK